MKIYEIQQFGIENLVLLERADPQPRANEVVVKFHAASLNPPYRSQTGRVKSLLSAQA